MKQFSHIIKDEIGLHARPAGMLAKEAKKYQSTVTLSCKGKSAAAKQADGDHGNGREARRQRGSHDRRSG